MIEDGQVAAPHIPFADEHFEGDAPTAAEDAFENDVVFTTMYFAHARDPENMAHDLATGLNRLRQVVRLPFWISDREHEALTHALYVAWTTADDSLPAKIDRARLRHGMDAAVALADWLKLQPNERRASTAGYREALDRTLILECDVTALSVEIDMSRREAIEREARRTAEVIPFPARARRPNSLEDVFR